MNLSKTITIALFVILNFLVSGCVTKNQPPPKIRYDLPAVPLERKVATSVIQKGQTAKEDGLILSSLDARNFVKNEIELRNYIEKLILLLKTIEESSDNIEIKGEWYK